MINGVKRLKKMVLNHDKQCGSVENGEGLWVTLAKNGNRTVMGR
jgi:hypothetical protein